MRLNQAPMEGVHMEMASTRAMLVAPGELDPSFDAITATIPRAEFEEALSWDEPAELLLDVRQAGEERTISVAWERADLERLLRDARGAAITLGFQHQELERALSEPDVEGHGLRAQAAVLTVAAFAAATGAARASVDPSAGGGIGGAGAQGAFSVAHDEAGLGARGIVATPTHDEVGLASRGIETPQATTIHDEAGLAARGIAGGSSQDEASLASRGIESQPTPAVHDEAGLVSRGIVEAPVSTHDEASLASRGIDPQPVSSDGGSGIDMPTIDATTAAVVGGVGGGLALLITAAGFAARRDRMRPA
jgi:hypothetical protein